MFITAFLSVAGIGLICWLLFNLAVYALPFFAGVSAGMFAYGTGSGPIGALLVGFTSGAVTLILGQVLLRRSVRPRCERSLPPLTRRLPRLPDITRCMVSPRLAAPRRSGVRCSPPSEPS